MPSFYFLWNPLKSRPQLTKELGDAALLLAAGKRVPIWNLSTGRRTRTDFPSGSDFFLVRTCKEPRGVIGYGTIPKGQVYPSRHYSDPRRGAIYVDIHFQKLIDSERNPEIRNNLPFEYLLSAEVWIRCGVRIRTCELPVISLAFLLGALA
jgi:hypothetical protein